MSAACPYRCTGSRARVRAVMARATAAAVERVALGIDVGEHRARPDHQDRQRRVGRRERRGDDLVAGADAKRPQDQGDGIGAVADANGVRRARCGGKFRLERRDLRAEHEPAAADDPLDGGANGVGVLVQARASCRECGTGSRLLLAHRGVDVVREVLAIESDGARRARRAARCAATIRSAAENFVESA